jgi:outer membrane protein assembly factor BamB
LIVAIMGKVLAFDPATGAPLWNCATDIGWYMVPSVVAHEGVVYVVGGKNGGGSLAVRLGGKGDVTSTHRLWKSAKGTNVTSPILHGGHLYWMNEVSGVAFCADAKTGAIVYEERVEGASQIYASPVVADGKIYYMSRNGRTAVVAAAPKFERLAMNDFGDRSTFNASPAVAGGRMYVRSDHHLYCLGKK